MLTTYGKRKKQIIPSFSSLRDSSASRPKGIASKKRASTALENIHKASISNPLMSHPSHHPQHDSSVDEIVSLLKDDTTIISEPSKRISMEHVEPPHQKDTPLLPQMCFKGADAWAAETAPVVASAGKINAMHFSNSSGFPEDSTSQFFGNSAEQSTPPIPRRSSKRKSAINKPPRSNVEYQQASLHKMTPPTTANHASAPPTQNMIDTKVKAMLAASNALKPNDSSGNLLQGPLMTTEKRRIKDNKVIVKVRTAINDRLKSRGSRNRHDSLRDDRLLDTTLHELHGEEGLSESVSAMDLRLNEGNNFKLRKVPILTVNGNIPRKPVADDGRSIRSKKSISNLTDPFPERSGSSGIARAPTNFDLSLNYDTSIEPSSESIPDLPTVQSRISMESLSRGKKLKSTHLAHDTNSFDEPFSSSPLGQSTPRMRLEPTFSEDGRRTLKSVPADSRSMFDPEGAAVGRPLEMDVDITSVEKQTPKRSSRRVKRANSEVEDAGVFDYGSVRKKKHPSPTDKELQALREAADFLKEAPFGTSESLIVSTPFKPNSQNQVLTTVSSISPMLKPLAPQDTAKQPPIAIGSVAPGPQILAQKDPNQKFSGAAKPAEKKATVGIFPKAQLPRIATMPDIYGRLKAQKVMVARPKVDATQRLLKYGIRDPNDTALEIDELQCNKSTYDIGIKKKA